MSFSLWATAFTDNISTISAEFLNKIRVDLSRALDGTNGGTYTLLSDLILNGAAVAIEVLEASGITVVGDVDITGAFDLTGDMTVTGAVDLTGNVTIAGALNIGTSQLQWAGAGTLSSVAANFTMPVVRSTAAAYFGLRYTARGSLGSNSTADTSADVFSFGDPSVATVDVVVTFATNNVPILFFSTAAAPANQILFKRGGSTFATFPAAANKAWVVAMYDGANVRVLLHGGGAIV
jgi:hypothetical protein